MYPIWRIRLLRNVLPPPPPPPMTIAKWNRLVSIWYENKIQNVMLLLLIQNVLFILCVHLYLYIHEMWSGKITIQSRSLFHWKNLTPLVLSIFPGYGFYISFKLDWECMFWKLEEDIRTELQNLRQNKSLYTRI